MLNDLSDSDLIARYVHHQDQGAMRVLVERHHDRLYSRFLGEIKNEADAKDLEQQLWLQVHRNLGGYRDEGKFTHYLSRIASNLLNDHWRRTGRNREVFTEARSDNAVSASANDGHIAERAQSASADEEQKLITAEMVDYLVTVLIPQLPVEQRMTWLLRHESEYWEPGRRLDWQHLASLNGLEPDAAWDLFETARTKLMHGSMSNGSMSNGSMSNGSMPNRTSSLEGEETLVFMVWSQAQRLHKEQDFTWDYFANLLGVSANTLKTRYRAAQKQLSEGLTAYMHAP